MKSLSVRWIGLLLLALGCGLVSTTAAGQDGPGQDESQELVQLVIDLLRDTDKDLRALGLEQVRTEAPGAAATQRFAAELPQLALDAQVGLLAALAQRGDPAARPMIVELMATARDPALRAAAIQALGYVGQASDVELLVKLLGPEGAAAERAAARASLIRLPGDDVAAALAAEQVRAAPVIRVTLLEILASRRAFETIPQLLSAAVDEEPTVRMAAMAALGQLAGPEHLPGMVTGVIKARAGEERNAAEKCVMFVCHRIDAPSHRAQSLLNAYQDLSPSDQLTLLPTLGRVGGPDVLPILTAAMADPKRHELGLRALSNWPDASIAPRLVELAKSDPHPAHRILALRTLIRIAVLRDERTDEDRLQLLRQAMQMCTRDSERNLVLQRARAIRIPATLPFVTAYLRQPAYAQQACETIVELAHHRELREQDKASFLQALDQVMATSTNATIIERAQRYKEGKTWTPPLAPTEGDEARQP